MPATSSADRSDRPRRDVGRRRYYAAALCHPGTAGSGKTSLAAHFRQGACNGERCLYMAFEESQGQLVRHMRSIGLDLESCVRKGLLQFIARPSLHGLEIHLAMIHKLVEDFRPNAVVLDPISSLARRVAACVYHADSAGRFPEGPRHRRGGDGIDEWRHPRRDKVGISSIVDTGWCSGSRAQRRAQSRHAIIKSRAWRTRISSASSC